MLDITLIVLLPFFLCHWYISFIMSYSSSCWQRGNEDLNTTAHVKMKSKCYVSLRNHIEENVVDGLHGWIDCMV